MKAPELATDNPHIRLVEPDVNRDAELGVQWLNGKLGRATMLSMGNTEETLNEILPTTLEKEEARVRDFLTRDDQLNWMIAREEKVVGSIWVDLEDSKDLPSPSVHLMIGDPNMRGKGIGSSSVDAVVGYLESQGNDKIYTRHLTTNEGSRKLLSSLGFTKLGEPYVSDTLEFQNLVKTLKTLSDYFSKDDFAMRLMTDGDVKSLVEIINEAYAYQYEAKGEQRTNPTHLRKRATDTDLYVVTKSEQIVGCIYTEPRPPSLHFGLLTVIPEYRGSGLAQAIMKAIEDYATDGKFTSLELDYMSLAPWLKTYYEKYGFQESGEVQHWGKIDLVRMKKVLPN